MDRTLIEIRRTWGFFSLRWMGWRHYWTMWEIKDFRRNFIRLWLGPLTLMAELNPPRLEEK